MKPCWAFFMGGVLALVRSGEAAEAVGRWQALLAQSPFDEPRAPGLAASSASLPAWEWRGWCQEDREVLFFISGPQSGFWLSSNTGISLAEDAPSLAATPVVESYDLAAGRLVLQHGGRRFELTFKSARVALSAVTPDDGLPPRPDRTPAELAREIARRQALQDEFTAQAPEQPKRVLPERAGKRGVSDGES